VKFHASSLRAEGGSEEEVQEVIGVPGLRGTRLTRREALILRFCRQAALDANTITDEQVAELKAEGLGDAEIVEMIETMNFTTAHTKLVDALGIEPDPWLA
jgi:alkylhydroperoxidase family enzyme